MATRISLSGGLQPNPNRDDIGGALVKEIRRKRSSYPLIEYMRDRLDNLAKAGGYRNYTDFQYKNRHK